MINWIKKKLGLHACEKWTKWEIKRAIASRSAIGEEILAGHRIIKAVRCWQERSCIECGYVQQSDLEYGAVSKEEGS